MQIQGIDYNTQRSRLRLPEYGRGIHTMVEHCKGIADRNERQACANAIIEVMARLMPEQHKQPSFRQKLWDHLAIISNFELDIDYPYEVTTADKVYSRPAKVNYPKRRIPIRHYGNLAMQTIEHICSMEEGPEREELTRLLANQMKRDIVLYGNANPDNERVFNDMARLSDGEIQVDPGKMKLDFITLGSRKQDKPKMKKKK